MQPGPHRDAINVRLVFRIYAWITITSGTFIYLWPLKGFFPEQLAEIDLDALPSAAALVDPAVRADSSTISQ
jgi:hypothetical protein